MDSYLAGVRFNPEVIRPHLLVIYREGHPDCMMGGRLERARLDLKVGYATLFNPRVLRLFVVRGGLLGNINPENCRLLMRELKRCLEMREAETAELSGVGRESNLRKAVHAEFSFPRRGHFSRPMNTAG